MKRRLITSILFALAASGGAHAASFDYHGSLQDAGKPAEGSYDIELTLYSAADGGRVIGGPLTLYKVPVHAGAFDTQADFGPLTKLDQGWLGVKVRSAGSGEFAALSARSPVTAASSASVCPGAWTLGGNAGNPAGSYLGTADNLPLVIQTKGAVAMTISPPAVNSIYAGTNIVAGDATNSIASGVVGALIAGGGDGLDSLPNKVGAGANLAVISGGANNQANGPLSVVAGGGSNIASGGSSIVLGGQKNVAGGQDSLAAGIGAVVRDSTTAGNCCGDYGTFVWSDDSSSTNFTSTGPNQFLVKATGGVGINGVPIDPNVELTITGNSSSNPTVDLVLISGDFTGAYDIAVNPFQNFGIYNVNGGTYTQFLGLDRLGDLTIAGAHAYKPNGGSWEAPSDARLKREVQPLAHMLDKLLQLRGVSFEYKQPDAGLHPAGRHTGFIAQEVQDVFPEWVGQTPDGYLSVGPTGFEAMTVEALRELRAEKDDEIAGLHDENTQLHAQLDDVLARLKRLEAGHGN